MHLGLEQIESWNDMVLSAPEVLKIGLDENLFQPKTKEQIQLQKKFLITNGIRIFTRFKLIVN